MAPELKGVEELFNEDEDNDDTIDSVAVLVEDVLCEMALDDLQVILDWVNAKIIQKLQDHLEIAAEQERAAGVPGVDYFDSD